MLAGKNVAIFDDSEDARETMCDVLSDGGYDPRPMVGPFSNVEELVSSVDRVTNAAVCDYKLNARNYAKCTGAQAVERFYKNKFPAVLVTRYSETDIDDICQFRRSVPVLLTPDQAEVDEIVKGWEVCMQEFNDNFLPIRKPWKTLVRIDDLDKKYRIIRAFIPAWTSSVAVRFPITIVPKQLRKYMKAGERFYAKVNIGAESFSDLYFEDFEYRGKYG